MITHTLFSIPSDPDSFIITDHCIKRFIQRFKLLMTLTEQQSTSMQIRLIKKLIIGGSVYRKFEFCPFYANKQATKHTHGDAIFVKTNMGVFVLKYNKKQKNKISVVTVFRTVSEI